MSRPSDTKTLGADTYLSWVRIDLGAILHNYRLLREFLPDHVSLFPVVKADAYGHGAVPVVRLLQEEGVERVCVARVEEGVELRQAGIKIKILVFTPPLLPQARVAAQHELEIVVCDVTHADAVAQAQRDCGKQVPVHIKTDVGMGRIGAQPGEVPGLLSYCRSKGLNVFGVMSHFPCADTSDETTTLAMTDIFNGVHEAVRAADETEDLYFHISNTAATLRYPQAWFNAVRSGISLYGQYPSYDMERTLPLRPAMSLMTRIVYLKDVPANTPVSYCHTYRTSNPATLATLALGYADGYPRHASNHTHFLVHGKRAPQVGRVCMDQLMIDVSDIPEAAIGDEVLAFGTSGNLILLAEEVAARFDSLGYELTSRIGKRLPRFFIENGSSTNESNHQQD